MTGEQRIVVFSGMVQGVGFRYTACRVAGGFDVTGTVRNLPDARVECVVEGDAAEIDAFLESLGQRMSEYIRGRTQQTAPYTGKYATFTVAY
jgi:acylphosphatase